MSAIKRTVNRVDRLSADESARLGAWADKWIELGLRTGPADRARFERAVRKCYDFAGIEWPGVVVWVPSPLVLSLAAPVAAFVIGLLDALKRDDAVDSAVDSAVRDAVDGAVHDAVGGAVRDAVDSAVNSAVGGAVDSAVDSAVRDAVDGAVHDAVNIAVRDAVEDAVNSNSAVNSAVNIAVYDAVNIAVYDAVNSAVNIAVNIAVYDAVDGAVNSAVHDAVNSAVYGAVSGAVHDAVNIAVYGAVSGAIRDAVHDAVNSAVNIAVYDAVNIAVYDAVSGAIRDAIRDAVDDVVHGAVSGAIRQGIADVIAKAWNRYFGGQFWCGGWYWWGPAFTSFFREVCRLALPGDLWDRGRAHEDTVESACWWWPHRRFVVVCERPTIINRELVDPGRLRGPNSHRLHSDTGPAIAWPDGWGVWLIHGVRVPRRVVESPDSLTVPEIDGEQNVEVRRIMIERYGQAKYLVDSGAQKIHQDDWGTLYRKAIPGDEPLLMVKVVNSTREPDGSMKDYFLRVDPELRPLHADGSKGQTQEMTARNAVASTFGKTGAEYRPAVQT